MTVKSEIHGRILAQNTLLNLLGYVVPLLLVVFATPFIIHGLGRERYGVLSLVWVILGYFTIFDLGLGAAVTRFVAAAIGQDRVRELPQLVWTAIIVQCVLGTIAGGVVAAMTPFFAGSVFSIPIELLPEAKAAFFVSALFFPVAYVSGSFIGVLSAVQRFDLVNVFKIANSAAIYLSAILGVATGAGIAGIVGLVLLFRLLVLVVQALWVIRIFPGMFRFHPSLEELRKMAAFGGWITISNSVNPLIAYIDRLLIGSTLGMAALTFYSVPFDLAARLWVISTSLTTTLIPAFALLTAKGKGEQVRDYYVKSINFLVVVTSPIICLMIVFSRPLLDVWVGSEFAQTSSAVLQVLLVSTMIDFPGIISSTLIEGAGNPRVLAIIKSVYLPVHLLVCFLCLSAFGLVGAALSIFLMRVVYACGFTMAALRLFGIDGTRLVGRLRRGYIISGIWLVASLLVSHYLRSMDLMVLVLVSAAMTMVYALVAWNWSMDHSERDFVEGITRRGVNCVISRMAWKRG